jgi:hypothetical protein
MSPSPPTSAGDARSRVRRSGGVVLPLVPGFERAPARRRPLPDAGAVRLLLVPDSAPPYDEGPAGTGPRSRSSGPPAPPGSREPPAPPESHERPAPPEPGPRRRGQPAAAGWPSQFAQVLAETLAGSRPQGQITPWTTDRARRLIRELGPMLATATAPRVRRVVTTRPVPGVVEMTVIVVCGARVRALAVRLERDGPHGASPGRGPRAARWVCTAIEAA